MLKGKFIGVKEGANVFVLERTFEVRQAKKVIVRATAQGVYFLQINGKRVGDAFLAPGWTSYQKTLQVQEYDVTELVQEGENTLSVTVGEGWCCGPLAWDSRRYYERQMSVCADVLADGKLLVCTDENWTARESYIRKSGIYDGETQDFTAERKPLTPVAVPFRKNTLIPQMCAPVRTVCRLPVKEVIRTPEGDLVYDFGQNIAGVAEIRTDADFSGTLTLRFAEILVKGNFYTENLRSAKATDSFTVQGEAVLSPEFTFHGFRYLKLEGAELPADKITALVRHTDLVRTGTLETDDARFNRLYQNVIWGQRGNFVDIPTDCPQRDERLGWTGDINAFCRTAAYNYDIRSFMKKWLRSLRDDQREDGTIPHVAPDILGWADTDAMWCDAVTMVPWTLYEMYGDLSFLSDNFTAMKKFIAARERAMEDGLVARGHEFGDWLALDKEVMEPESPFGRTDNYFLSNVLHSMSLSVVARAAKLLGKEKAEKKYSRKYESHLKKMRREYFTRSGRLAFDTITAQAVALHFNIVPEKQREKLAAALNENVLRHGCRVTTGFIGTPFLLYALADNGYFDTACKLLLNNEYPGWLYEVDMGATTIWERWNSLTPDGMPNPDGMNSYNHYAYGSVMEFVYRRIAGIEAASAGFEKVTVRPCLCKGLARVSASYDSVRGKICAGYEEKGDEIVYFAEVPENVEAQLILPGEEPVALSAGKHTFVRKRQEETQE